MQNNKLLLLGVIVLPLAIAIFKTSKIGPCSPELEHLINKRGV